MTLSMEERLEFVREFGTELFSMTELATHYGSAGRPLQGG